MPVFYLGQKVNLKDFLSVKKVVYTINIIRNVEMTK